MSNAIWNFFMAVGEARAKRDLMTMQAIHKHRLGR